jgi:PilZ domain
MNRVAKSRIAIVPSNPRVSMHVQEVRCAVRFPLSLPVVIKSARRRHPAQTRNVSASGVLFDTESAIRVGERISFSLRMPGGIMGTSHDVLVDCTGRVVRCSKSQTKVQVAATIDEYRFVER